MTKAKTAKASAKKICVTQVKSSIGCIEAQRQSLSGLGLGKVGKSDIVVPDAFYKALLIPYKGSYLSIGFYMPNEAAPKGAKLKDYAVTVAELEGITGRIFFASIGPAFQIKEQLPLKELGLY